MFFLQMEKYKFFSKSMPILSHNTSDQLELDRCSAERLSLNISLFHSKELEQNSTQTAHRMGQLVKCLKQAIYEAEWTSKCPLGWTLLNQRCYFFSIERKPRGESHQFCEQKDSQLASVKQKDTMLQGLIKGQNAVYWIGLTQKRDPHDPYAVMQWYWPDGTIDTYLPNTEGQSCAKMGSSLSVHPCDFPLQWICEMGTANSNLFERMKTCYS
ncbi:killer cell lectin-like receptor subfamily G member 1 [Xenopus laevis]|uniref:Killer cell lectin-like receptor subfamily G member 1 n=1 Tax=Xenopus laevis TaxID=8355 RepID=A0A8J1MH95_XENLA|nr:killer cell lectin-like receptor subfamily G member 1 [Xenopus laevis]